MRHLFAFLTVLALAFASVATADSENGNKLQCFDGTSDGGFNGVCTLTAEGATLNTIDGDADPNNNLLPGERHITVAWGRDFSDVSPLRGVTLGAGGQRLEVAVDVVPELEA